MVNNFIYQVPEGCWFGKKPQISHSLPFSSSEGAGGLWFYQGHKRSEGLTRPACELELILSLTKEG